MKSSQTGASPVPECREGELVKEINFDALLVHLQIVFERTVYYISCERHDIKSNNRRNRVSLMTASFRLSHPKSFSAFKTRRSLDEHHERNHHRWVDIDNYLVRSNWLHKHIAAFIIPSIQNHGRYPWRHGWRHGEHNINKVIGMMKELKLITNIDDNYELTWLKCG